MFLDKIQHADKKEQIEHCDYLLDNLEQSSVAYTAGWIEKKIENSDRFLCAGCINVFSENDKIAEAIRSSKAQAPCKTTFKICKLAHKCMKSFGIDPNYKYDKLLSDIMQEIDFINSFPKTNFEGHESHKFFFIKTIADEFIRTQATYMAKTATLNEQRLMLRNKLKKTIHFHNQ